jgi:hypothetical protein
VIEDLEGLTQTLANSVRALLLIHLLFYFLAFVGVFLEMSCAHSRVWNSGLQARKAGGGVLRYTKK